MTEIAIRKARQGDYQDLMRLYGLFIEKPGAYDELGEDSYARVLACQDAWIEVATAGKEIAGFITYSIRSVVRYGRPILEVEELFVLEEFRRRGVAKTLMEHAVAKAEERDCEYIFLASGKKRTAAHELYKGMGFDEYAFHYRRRP